MFIVTLKTSSMMQEDTGGRKWAVMVSAFFVQFIICGITYSMGIFHVVFRHIFAGSHFDTSWVSALLLHVTVISSVLFRFVTAKFGSRVSVMLGGLLSSIGLALGVCITELYEIYLCMGVLTGIGFGIACSPSIVAVEQYFHRCRYQALSTVLAGIGCGIIVFPNFIRYLLEIYAWRGTLLLLSAITLNLCVCGAIMKPLKFEKEVQLLPLLSCMPLRNPLFYAMCIGNFFWSFGSTIIYIFLPSYAISMDTDFITATFLVSCIGMASFTSRVIFAFMGHNSTLDDVTAILCSVGLGAVITGTCPLLFKHYSGQISYTLLFGFYSGFWTTFMSQVTRELLGPHYIAIGNGYLSFMIALGSLGAPCAALLIQAEDEYTYAFYLAGACLLTSATIMVLFKYRQCGSPTHLTPSEHKIPLMNTSNGTATKCPDPTTTYRYYEEDHMVMQKSGMYSLSASTETNLELQVRVSNRRDINHRLSSSREFHLTSASMEKSRQS
ncbi:monocarboxylate transporter 13 isoform X2 [Octopus bimaculoides]|uniref:Major facilitator superfamily (MFS) profile domain-containing protein n=1 Tax=Octopus bimaculoides TaxID=37653 RepID=A0A0L8GQQ8_OCTBM|nr:monocarboxylate transporter 13 isoform X2 [Octopus bimaculoides]|eukprot:XP_014779051.1 PREDICTED: monocarboxylate transporter 13-like isoform X2 [Octopus bimaculoides]